MYVEGDDHSTGGATPLGLTTPRYPAVGTASAGGRPPATRWATRPRATVSTITTTATPAAHPGRHKPAHTTQPKTPTIVFAASAASVNEPRRPIAPAMAESSTITSAWTLAARSCSTSS